MVAQDQVLLYRKSRDYPSLMPVLRDVPDFMIERTARGDTGKIGAVQEDLAPCWPSQAGEDLHQLSLSVPLHPGDPEDLAGAQFETDSVERAFSALAVRGQVLHL